MPQVGAEAHGPTPTVAHVAGHTSYIMVMPVADEGGVHGMPDPASVAVKTSTVLAQTVSTDTPALGAYITIKGQIVGLPWSVGSVHVPMLPSPVGVSGLMHMPESTSSWLHVSLVMQKPLLVLAVSVHVLKW